MRVFIICLISLNLNSCSPEKIGRKWEFTRIIRNKSSHNVELGVFNNGLSDFFSIPNTDSLTFYGKCLTAGGDLLCDIGYDSFITERDVDDSVHIIFDNGKYQKFYPTSDTCCLKNILFTELQFGYVVEGRGTDFEIYTYTITEEDYKNAEVIGGG